MTYEHDPIRNDPTRANHPVVPPSEPGSGSMVTAGILGALFIFLLAFMLWPAGENRTNVATDTSTRVERPATPTPATPPANKPQTDLKPTTPPAKTPAQ